MHALVVEDDEKISSFVAKGLREAGFVVDVAADGVEGLEIGLSGRFDVAVVDVMLPGLDGLTLIERLRAARVQTPVLILSARRTVDDRVRGLQAGGDDYMVKPFAFSRCWPGCRRSSGGPLPPPNPRCSGWPIWRWTA